VPAFNPYRGAYAFGDEAFTWQCYATVRVYELRRVEHARTVAAPEGRRWALSERHPEDLRLAWLIDADAAEFSHILSRVADGPEGAALRTAHSEGVVVPAGF
jgi:hypothetical protein